MENDTPKTDSNKTITYYIIAILLSISLVAIGYIINYSTVYEVKVPAPCEIIMSDSYEIPDNVITKGYDVIRTNVIDFRTGEPMEKIDYDCYYIKDAGLLERTYRNWSIYQ